MKYNACISIISSRTKSLRKCLESIYKFYNYRYNYPVYVYYFDDIYDSPVYRKIIHDSISPNIHFIRVPYKTPAHIKEQELFYNRKELWYVRKHFSIDRKGYLHMCHFVSNCYKYSNTLIHEYDYVMFYDDESGYTKELPYDPVEVMVNRPEDMGALIVGQRLVEGKPHQGNIDCRTGLWSFTKDFLLRNNIKPKSQLLKKLMMDKNAEWNFHFLPWADTYVIKTKMYKSELWKKWIGKVNKNGGIYKFRWGDNEIMSLFYLIYDDKPIFNLQVVQKKFINQGLFRQVQNKAPGVLNLEI